MQIHPYEVRFPKTEHPMDQHEEWFMVDFGETQEKFRIHEYDRIYQVPGLYETVVHDRLECDSPQVISRMLKETLERHQGISAPLRALDFGAGNGMVGELLQEELMLDSLVGVDIYKEARAAADRDRPGVYDDYYVLDLAHLAKKDEAALCRWRFNALVTVAALGFNDICTKAFLKAFNIVEEGAWIAFNIRDKFLESGDRSGFRDVFEMMMDESLHVLASRHYRHRVSIPGEPLFYYAVIGRKRKDAAIM